LSLALFDVRSKKPSRRWPPASMALLIQFIAFGLAAIALQLYEALLGQINSGLSFILIDAVFAGVITWKWMKEAWWKYISTLFPISLWLSMKADIPNGLYLFAFIASVSLFWSTFRSRVPFYPSLPATWKAVEKVIPTDRPLRIIDIGSGIGDFSMKFAELRPDSIVSGIEIAPLLWFTSFIRSKINKSTATFTRGSYEDLDFSQYDVIFAYLSPAATAALWTKASHEMNPGCMLISHEFAVDGVTPDQILTANGLNSKTFIYKRGFI